MRTAKVKRLTAPGWAVGDARDFLELTEEEAAFLELKLALADGSKPLRCQAFIMGFQTSTDQPPMTAG